MATLIWTESALADLEEIGKFISKDNPPALRKWAPTSFGKRKNLAAFPRLGRIVPEFGNPQFREIISRSYGIIYKFDEEGDLVAILRIWHGGGFRLYGRAESCAFGSWCLGCIISLGRNGPLSIPDFDSCWIVLEEEAPTEEAENRRVDLIRGEYNSQVEHAGQANDNEVDCHDKVEQARHDQN
jgi:toxin ParE1/3/4